jgi:hypothetical protein
MAKVLSGFPLVFMVRSAYAQTPAADTPAGEASILPVVIFLLLFVGACVAYFAYLWWNERKRRQGEAGEKPR